MKLLVIFLCSLGLLLAAPAKKKKRTTRRGGGYMQGQRKAGQRVPTPARYKEIETALASRGYLTKEPNGVWDKDSIAALKKFQQDQHLEPTGKLTSLSLIGLGLGPKYETASSIPTPQQ